MNWYGILCFYVFLSWLAALLLLVLNPYFENKDLLRWDLLAVGIAVVLSTIAIGLLK